MKLKDAILLACDKHRYKALKSAIVRTDGDREYVDGYAVPVRLVPGKSRK